MLIPGQFVISALEVKAPGVLETVYYAEDNASGGYPYWSPYFHSARTFDKRPNFEERIGGCHYMYERVTMIKVYEVKLEEV